MMSTRSWALLVVGGAFFIAGRVILVLAPDKLRDTLRQEGSTNDMKKLAADISGALHVQMAGFALILASMVIFGFAAWRIYHETQLPKPGDRTPRQPGGGGF